MSTSATSDPSATVVVTGANGLVGSRVCAALSERGAAVRAVVRRPGTAPDLPGLTEHVGDFADPDLAREVLAGATAAVTTVYPLGSSDRDEQHRASVEGTTAFARAALDAGARLLVHVSTAAVYDRSPGTGDVDEGGALVGDDAGDYAVVKRDTDAALAEVDGLTRVLLRPPAILGPGDSSVWNALRPAQMREDEAQRHAVPDASWPWVHVDDLAALAADVATGATPTAATPDEGPVDEACVVVDVAGEPATQRDYYEAVLGAQGLEPVWDDEPAWTGAYRTDRAHRWGWSPSIGLTDALNELGAGLRTS